MIALCYSLPPVLGLILTNSLRLSRCVDRRPRVHAIRHQRHSRQGD